MIKFLFNLVAALIICGLFGPWACIGFGIALAVVEWADS